MPIIRSTGAVVAARDLSDPPSFDPTCGMSFDELIRCEAPRRDEEPSDFDAFWEEVRDGARAIDPEPRVTGWRPWRYASGAPDGAGVGGYEVADLVFRSVHGTRLGGWVVRPQGGADEIAVCGHGYEGRTAPACDDVAPSALCVYPVARGLPARSSLPGIGRDPGQTPHVVWGIESPETYSVVRSAADFSVAATVGPQLLPDARRVVYHGGSFGGGVGAMTLSFDDRFDAAVLGVPTFGNQPVRVTQPTRGSWEAARRRVADDPAILETLRYADAASAARRVRVPVVAMPALADPIVPPPGQFAVAGSLAGPVWRHALAGAHGRWRDLGAQRSSADPREWQPAGPDARQPARPTPDRIDAFLRDPTPLVDSELADAPSVT